MDTVTTAMSRNLLSDWVGSVSGVQFLLLRDAGLAWFIPPPLLRGVPPNVSSHLPLNLN